MIALIKIHAVFLLNQNCLQHCVEFQGACCFPVYSEQLKILLLYYHRLIGTFDQIKTEITHPRNWRHEGVIILRTNNNSDGWHSWHAEASIKRIVLLVFVNWSQFHSIFWKGATSKKHRKQWWSGILTMILSLWFLDKGALTKYSADLYAKGISHNYKSYYILEVLSPKWASGGAGWRQ